MRHGIIWMGGVIACLAVGCNSGDGGDGGDGGDAGGGGTPGEQFCSAVADQLGPCAGENACADALVADCAGIAGILNDALLSAAATCVQEGGGPFACLAQSRNAVTPTAAHQSLGSAFCSNCALGVPGCEEALFGEADGDLAVASALITPLGDDLVAEVESECASGLTCLATFSSCVQEVLVRRAIPEATIQCLLDNLVSGGVTGGSSCGGASAGSASAGSASAGGTGGTGGAGTDGSASATTAGTGGATTTDGSTGGETAGGDPNYPPPMGGMCPGGFAGPVSFADRNTTVCAPQCMGQTCPDGATGTAFALCGFNPNSSQQACMTIDDCPAGEDCIGTGAEMLCFLPPSHCLLTCMNTGECPDGMVCTATGTCEYPN